MCGHFIVIAESPKKKFNDNLEIHNTLQILGITLQQTKFCEYSVKQNYFKSEIRHVM